MSNKTLPKKFNPQDFEKKWQKIWEDQELYKWNHKCKREDTFSVDTPPPTVSGSLHIGHVFSYTQTDIQVRFNRMKGKNIFYPMGWDDNGLPSERRVQNVYGIQCNPDIAYDEKWIPKKCKGGKVKQISRKNFIKACSILTKQDEIAFKDLYTKLGLSVDWSLEYDTIGKHSQQISQLSFLDLVNKGQVYSCESPTMWDIDFQTAIAQAELEDREDVGYFYDLAFNIQDSDEKIIISTTRPELLGACIAVVVHPEDSRYSTLVGKKAIIPLYETLIPILTSKHAERDKGTGALMICTFGDSSDVEWWKQSQLPVKQIIDRSGKIIAVDFGKKPFESLSPKKALQIHLQLVGKDIPEAKKKISELLHDFIIGDPKKTIRSINYYEKGYRPVEYISTRQWFIKILDHKKDLIDQGNKICWYPEHMKSRYLHWVIGLNQDWCISRQRYFGIPFPVWYPLDQNGSADYSRPIFASKEQLPVDPMVDCPKDYSEEQRNKPGGFIAEKDVMDTWATSSMTPQIATHWIIDKDKHGKLFPMDIRPQSHEIIRTWTFYTIVKSWLHEKEIPWKNITISGWILDPDRKKMSKSKGNVETPEEFFDKYSADAIRYWSSRAKLGADSIFDENVFKIGIKLSNKLFHASKFVLMQLNDYDQSILDDVANITEELDKSWYSKILKLIESSTKSFENFDYASSIHATEDHFWNFCDHYLEIVKGRSYLEGNSKKKLSCLVTLNLSLQTFLKLFAPILSHLCEEIWSWRYSDNNLKTIHKNTWPCLSKKDLKFIEANDDINFELAKQILANIRAKKSEKQKKMKWPVSQLEIKANKSIIDRVKIIMPDLIKAGSIKNDQVFYQQIDTNKDQSDFSMMVELEK